MAEKILITYWTDYCCPYCHFVTHELKEKLRALGVLEQVEFKMLAFELEPDAPAQSQGTFYDKMVTRWGLSEEHARRKCAKMTRLAQAAGLARMEVAGTPDINSFNLHRLTKYAAGKGLADALHEKLMKAFYEEHRDISQPVEMMTIAAECGLDPEMSIRVLATDAYAAEVRADEKAAADLSITSIPHYMIGGEVFPDGGNVPAMVTKVLELLGGQAEAASAEKPDEYATGAACTLGPDGKYHCA